MLTEHLCHVFSKNNPPTMGILQAHISQHISLMAREEIEAKNAAVQEQAQQFGGQIPHNYLQRFKHKMNVKLLKELQN